MKLIDLGNSNAKIFEGSSITKICTDQIIDYLEQTTEEVLLCSVVPRYNKIIKERFPNVKIVSNKDYKKMFDNESEQLATKGADRMVAAFGAVGLYGPNVVVIDVGTCVTFDVIANRVYQDGLIYPGFAMLENLLSEKIEQLPLGQKSSDRIATASQIYSASVLGFIGALNNMTAAMIPDESYKVVVTGGSILKLQEEYGVDLLAYLGVGATYEPELIKLGLLRLSGVEKGD